MNKFIIGVSAVLVFTSTVSAYTLYRENQTQTQQLGDYATQVNQLLAHVEENTRLRLDFENRIKQLNESLLASNNRIQVLDSELETTLDKVNPDFEQMESDIRSRVSNEYRRQYEATVTPTPASLISQLSLMDSEERMAILAIQGQYGGFLDSLNTSPERKDQITQALIDVTLGQNQARQDLVSQELPPRQMRSQLMSIMSPEATREALAYELTEEELVLLDENQQGQNRVITGTIGANGIYRIRGAGPNGLQPERRAADVLINSNIGNATVREFIIDQSPADN